MKHKTAELEGALLDAAVAMADGEQARIESNGRCAMLNVDREHGDGTPFWSRFEPSYDWQQGGPIIERERIKLHPPETRRPGVNWEWQADCYGTIDSPGEYFQNEAGPTPLVAAMRAYVASKLGEEIELP